MEKDLTEKLFEELKKQGIYEQEDTIEDEDEEIPPFALDTHEPL